MSYSREETLIKDFPSFQAVELKTDPGLVLHRLAFQQTKILPKLLKYCEVHLRDPVLIEKLQEGFCNGIAIVCLNAIASTLTGQGGNSLHWFEECTSLIEGLNEDNMRTLSPGKQKLIDDFLGLIEGFQHAQDYEAVAQSQLQQHLSAAGVQYHQIGKLAGAFTPGDFLKTIDVPKLEVKADVKQESVAKKEKMIDLVAQEGSISLVGSHNHATGFLTTHEYYYYFDANQGLYRIPRNEKSTLIKLMNLAHYSDTLNEYGWTTTPCPLSFNIVSRRKVDHPLSHPEVVSRVINRTDAVEKDLLKKLEFGFADKYTPLHMAAAEGDVASLEAWLKKYEKDGKLKEALNKNYERNLSRSLEIEDKDFKEPEDKDVIKNSPLVTAAMKGHARFVEKYLEHFSDIKPEEIKKAFSGALTYQFLDVAAILAPYVQDVDFDKTVLNRFTETYNVPLYLAARLNHVALAEALVMQGVKLTQANKDDGNTPLHIALKQGNKEMVDFLLEKMRASKDNYNIVNKDGETILHIAAEKGYDSIVDKILKVDPTLVSKVDKAGNTPLHTLAKSSNIKLTERFIEDMKNINITNKAGETALHIAAQYGNNDMIRKLLEKKAEITADKDGNDPLHIAARAGKVDTIRMLVKEYKGDLGSSNHAGQTPYFLAVLRGRDAAAKELKTFATKGQLLLTDLIGNSPLHLLSNNSPELVKKMVTTYELDINQKNGLGETPLIAAINENKHTLIKALLEHKGSDAKSTIDINLTDDKQQSPLQLAISKRNKEVVKSLILLGANVNVQKGESIFATEFKENNPDLFKIWLDRKKIDDSLTISEGDAKVIAGWVKIGSIQLSALEKKQISIKEGPLLTNWLKSQEIKKGPEKKVDSAIEIPVAGSAVPKKEVLSALAEASIASVRQAPKDDSSKSVITPQELQTLEKHIHRFQRIPGALTLDAFKRIDEKGNSKLSLIMNDENLDKNTKFSSLVKILYENLDAKKNEIDDKKISASEPSMFQSTPGKKPADDKELLSLLEEIYSIVKAIASKHPEFNLDMRKLDKFAKPSRLAPG